MYVLFITLFSRRSRNLFIHLYSAFFEFQTGHLLLSRALLELQLHQMWRDVERETSVFNLNVTNVNLYMMQLLVF